MPSTAGMLSAWRSACSRVIQAGRVYAYFCGSDGRWVPVGDFADQNEAVRFAQAEAPEGVTIEASRGWHGELYLRAHDAEQDTVHEAAA